MEESNQSPFSFSSLLCHEDGYALAKEEERYDEEHNDAAELDMNWSSEIFMDDELVEMMVQRETSSGLKSSGFSDGCSSVSRNWLQSARLDAINWILHARAHLGFRFCTAYLSVSYLDRFLLRRSIDNGKLWAIRLLSIACLSVAAKMEDVQAPNLSQYPSGEFEFESKVIKRMEMLVLNTLEWKLASTTPFDYLHYFSARFYRDPKRPMLLPRAMQLVLGIMKEINHTEYQPSYVAAAAILATIDAQLNQESGIDDQLRRKPVETKLSSVSSWGLLRTEHVLSCYRLMQQMEIRKCRTPADVCENYCSVSYAVGSKRRLTFGDFNGDCHCPLKKLH